MTQYNTISWIRRILRRGLLKDRLKNNNDAPVVFEYDGDSTFTLPDDNVSESTIVVKKNGTALSDSEWSYDSSTKEVTVTASLTANDLITITYSFYEKYGDEELKDYIEGSLALFAQYGYRKLFTLDSSGNNVITYDGIKADLKECYQIAIITAINIDPKNVNISTREFTISAEESKSKSDLIAEAFAQFMNFTGEVSFDVELGEEE
jgi:hypothetical protein